MITFACQVCGRLVWHLSEDGPPDRAVCAHCANDTGTVDAASIRPPNYTQVEIEKLSKELADCRLGRLRQFHETVEAKAKLKDAERGLDRIGDWLVRNMPGSLQDNEFNRAEAALELLDFWHSRYHQKAEKTDA